MISPDPAKIRQWLDAVIHPDTEGWIQVARGIDGKFNDEGAYKFRPGYWRETSFRCPRDRGEAVKWLAEHAQDDDVYCCPNATKTRQRTKGNTVGIRTVHSDVDKKFDIYDKVIDRGNGIVVASGTADHGQVLVPLADTVTTDEHELLCRGLSKRLNADCKVSDNDVLRPAGTVNHKGRARGGASTLVDFIREPQTNVKKIKARVLAAELGVDLSNIATTNGSSADTDRESVTPSIPGADDAPKPVDMGAYSWIQNTLDEPHPDRSTHISHVVRDCFNAGLTLPETRWVINQRADLVAKLAELHHDDVLRNWNKTAAEWPHRQIRIAAQVAAIVAGLPPKAKAKRTFIDGATFILDIPSTIPALWGEDGDVLWAEGESLMIAAPLGLGKTTLGGLLLRAQLGIGPATLLGYPVPARTGKILLLAMDRPAQVARALSRQFTTAERQILADRLVVWKGPPEKDVARNPELLAEMAADAGAETLYLDSVKDAALGLSDDEVGAGYNRARQRLLTAGVQLCEEHHTVKRNPKGGAPLSVADIYGSAWITNGTGSIILLTGDPGDPIVGFLHLRAPANTVGPYKLIHDQDAGTFDIHDRTDLLSIAKASSIHGVTATAAASAVFDVTKPTAPQVEKARRKLDKLVDKGLLQRVDGAKGTGAPTVWYAT